MHSNYLKAKMVAIIFVLGYNLYEKPTCINQETDPTLYPNFISKVLEIYYF